MIEYFKCIRMSTFSSLNTLLFINYLVKFNEIFSIKHMHTDKHAILFQNIKLVLRMCEYTYICIFHLFYIR